MVSETEIRERIVKAIPEARVEVEDATGTGDHWRAVVISSQFEGQSAVQRQRAVYGALGDLMAGPIHALQLQTLTPDQHQSLET